MAGIDPTVFDKKSRPAYKMALLIGAGFAAYVYFAQWDGKQATAAAKEVIQPLEKKMDDHIAETNALRPIMISTTQELKHGIEVNARNQYRICLKLKMPDCEAP